MAIAGQPPLSQSEFSVQPQCSLCLRGEADATEINHRDTEDTKGDTEKTKTKGQRPLESVTLD